MKVSETLTLKRQAVKAGGDRYESDSGLVIYIPQRISRPYGSPLEKITVTFETVEEID